MTLLNGVEVKTECIHFRGDIPCRPHKQHGVHCKDCTYFTERKGRILIIKLGATGDVIRTSVILDPIRKQYPQHEIWWISDSPEVVPSTVHKRLKHNSENVTTVLSVEFDIVINLDKDLHACALASKLVAKELRGYTLRDGLPFPANEAAKQKYLTGVFDDLNKQNKMSYPEEIVQLCGFEYSGQEYEMDAPQASPLAVANRGRAVIGLNTGCGTRWLAREWPLEYWEKLIVLLQNDGYTVVLLGGPPEHKRNEVLRDKTKAIYQGTYTLKQFPDVVNVCDVVVTTVTMALHVAIALKKQVVLFNNIFNKYEFELYGRGVLVEPPKECMCFFQHACTNKDYQCMDLILPEQVLEEINARIAYL